jgi:hypothetical protein
MFRESYHILVAALVYAATPVSAAEFPLALKQRNMWEALNRMGGIGSVLTSAMPSILKKGPKTTSSRPLYGSLPSGIVFYFDESGGTGWGYDTMVVDLNGNADLSDDPGFLKTQPPPQSDMDDAVFGPIELLMPKPSGKWQASFYAKMHVYSSDKLASRYGNPYTTLGYTGLADTH